MIRVAVLRAWFACGIVSLVLAGVLAQPDGRDSSPHTARLIAVSDDVRLQVLDWGGSGRALVLLAGQGNTAHVFDDFAPKLAGSGHIYSITRRGFGASTASAEPCLRDCRADDVLAVIDALKLDRPALAGHSVAGEELGSIGSRHPEKVAGLIFLDAGYGHLMPIVSFADGEPKYAAIPVPILAIFAVPHAAPAVVRDDPAALRAFEARDAASGERDAKRFEANLPSARVVRLAHADHYVFRSNEADVLREMRDFLLSLR
ncbi:MAG TPA: alpha/beta hydrolase [Bryobacteraceae bacterium]|jgi:pimeloyl-ACP methyl ester carboxylesterase